MQYIFQSQKNSQTPIMTDAKTVEAPIIQSPVVERRFGLEDFFLNRGNQQQQQQVPQLQIQQPQNPQVQIAQPQPNQMVVVRDAQFPSSQGGLLSRLIFARRMFRLRRIARRLSFIPQILGLGLGQQARISNVQQPQPLVLFNRIGQQYEEPYDPREFVYGDKGFSYGNNVPSNQQQTDISNNKQLGQRQQSYSESDSQYFDGINDVPFDQYDQSNYKSLDSFENQDGGVNNQFREQKKFKLVDSNREIPKATQDYDNSELLSQNEPEKLKNNQQQLIEQILLQQKAQLAQAQQQHALLGQQVQNFHQPQLDVQQLNLPQQDAHSAQLQQQNLQQLILQNQQNLQQLQQAYDKLDSTNAASAGDRTENGGHSPSIGIGGYSQHVAIGGKAPNVVNSNYAEAGGHHKHAAVPVKVEEPLIPLGILPKPLLNVNGRVFFGAEMGKGVKAGR